MHIEEVLKTISYRISNSSEYCYSCFVANQPRNYEFVDKNQKPIGNFTTDITGKVYEISVEFKEKDGCYHWVDSNFKELLNKETEKNGFDPSVAWDDVLFTEIDLEEDILKKLFDICENNIVDERISIEIDISDELFLHLAKEAHKRDITLNKMIEVILKEMIDSVKLENNKRPMKKFSTF